MSLHYDFCSALASCERPEHFGESIHVRHGLLIHNTVGCHWPKILPVSVTWWDWTFWNHGNTAIYPWGHSLFHIKCIWSWIPLLLFEMVGRTDKRISSTHRWHSRHSITWIVLHILHVATKLQLHLGWIFLINTSSMYLMSFVMII